jgi:osmotically-inducible protein OsmY
MSLVRRAAIPFAAMVMVVGAACAGDTETMDDTAAGALGATTGAVPSTPAAATLAEDADDRIETALGEDTNLRGFNLDADRRENRIVLRGRVRTEAQKTQAGDVALRVTPGVTLDNRILVEANAPQLTTQIVDADQAEEQVENALEADAVLGPFDLEVDEDDGKIVITGNVRSNDQKASVDAIAKRIAGNVQVVNRVRVQP